MIQTRFDPRIGVDGFELLGQLNHQRVERLTVPLSDFLASNYLLLLFPKTDNGNAFTFCLSFITTQQESRLAKTPFDVTHVGSKTTKPIITNSSFHLDILPRQRLL